MKSDEVETRSSLLTVKDLTVEFGTGADRVLAVDRLTFAIARGETVGLVGESGAGKSVTSLALMGLLSHTSARVDPASSIHFQGVDLLHAPETELRKIRGNRIALVPQDPAAALNPVLRIGDQVAEALLAHSRADRSHALARVVELFEEVGLPDPELRYGMYPHELSGGQQQRVMIAMALACGPDLLIADEPTTALDVTVQAQVLELLRDLQRSREMAVLLITHDLAVIGELCDRVFVVRAGQIVEEGATDHVFTAPRHPYTRDLLGPMAPRADGGGGGNAGGEPLLATRNLTKVFRQVGVLSISGRGLGSVEAVRGVSLDVQQGETLGLVGESGSGKSTLGRCLVRLLEPTSGSVLFEGSDIHLMEKSELRRFRGRVQIIFQDALGSLNPRMRAGVALTEALKVHGLGGQSRRERWQSAERLIERVGLERAHLHRFPHQLSGGQRQRVGIARALAVEPDLIVLDEPVSALDVSVRTRILDLLMTLQEELGLTYIFISHDFEVIERVSTRVAVMHDGKIVEVGPTDAITRRAEHPYTRRLLSSVLQRPGAASG